MAPLRRRARRRRCAATERASPCPVRLPAPRSAAALPARGAWREARTLQSVLADARLLGGSVTVSVAERLRLDAAKPVAEIATALRQQVGQVLRRSGIVVAMSGGVDSSVCGGLAVRAVGPGRVLGLALPERESDGESLALAREWAAQLGIELVVEDLTATLEGSGCYARRDAAIRRVTRYGEGWRCKLVMENGGRESGRPTVGLLVVPAPDGAITQDALPARDPGGIVAAANYQAALPA